MIYGQAHQNKGVSYCFLFLVNVDVCVHKEELFHLSQQSHDEGWTKPKLSIDRMLENATSLSQRYDKLLLHGQPNVQGM